MRAAWTPGLDLIELMGGALVAALLISFLCLELAKQLRRWHLIAGPADNASRGVGSTVLAITIGLCAVSLWTGHQQCQNAQTNMAESLIQAYRACQPLPDSTRQQVAEHFVSFIEQTTNLNDELGSIGPDNRFWNPLHQAYQAVVQASGALDQSRQIFIESRFDELLKDRFSWASSFFYGLHPLLWVTLGGATVLILIISAIRSDSPNESPWPAMLIVSVPLAFILASCLSLSHPFSGICRIDTSALQKLIPLLQQGSL